MLNETVTCSFIYYNFIFNDSQTERRLCEKRENVLQTEKLENLVKAAETCESELTCRDLIELHCLIHICVCVCVCVCMCLYGMCVWV